MLIATKRTRETSARRQRQNERVDNGQVDIEADNGAVSAVRGVKECDECERFCKLTRCCSRTVTLIVHVDPTHRYSVSRDGRHSIAVLSKFHPAYGTITISAVSHALGKLSNHGQSNTRAATAAMFHSSQARDKKSAHTIQQDGQSADCDSRSSQCCHLNTGIAALTTVFSPAPTFQLLVMVLV